MRTGRVFGIFVLLIALSVLALAQYSSKIVRPQGGDSLEVASGGAINVASGGALNVAAGGTLTTTGNRVQPATAVELTSPTVTFSGAGKNKITLTSDANLTGVRPTGGTLGQHLLIRTGAGSNTMRLDSGASMTLNGSNLTFTESQNDNVELECTNAEGDEWRLLWHNGGS
jgi:hypothetical protein